MQLGHVEISVPNGTLTDDFGVTLDRLLTDVFGWAGETRVLEHPTLGASRERRYVMTRHAYLVLREGAAALEPGTEDHLGFEVDRGELDRLLSACLQLARNDDRVELGYLDGDQASGVDTPDFVFRTFFVRYLLPLWFQFEVHERT